MTLDFGSRRRPAWRNGERGAYLAQGASYGAMLALFLIVVAVPVLFMLSAGTERRTDEPTPKVQGRPCTPISRAEFLRGWGHPPHSFVFQGVRFERRAGDADCQVFHEMGFGRAYTVCRLSTPSDVGVLQKGRADYFRAGAGWTVQVEARPEGARCAIVGRFRMET